MNTFCTEKPIYRELTTVKPRIIPFSDSCCDVDFKQFDYVTLSNN